MLYAYLYMFVRGFAAISLLGGLGVEDHQNGLTSLGSSIFRDTQEEPRFMQDGALPYLFFMLVRGFPAITLLAGLGVEDRQNGLSRLTVPSFVILRKNRALCKMEHYHICASCWCVVLQPLNC